jgi:hypothetical protein
MVFVLDGKARKEAELELTLADYGALWG